MTRPERSVRNTVKNITLVLLVALMVILCAANWLTGIDIDQIPADSPVRQLYEKVFGGAIGYELRASGVAAATPAQLALTVDGTLTAVQYSLTDVDAAMESVRPLWAAALSAEDLAETDETALTEALAAGDCALLRYHGAIPLSIVSGWMGGGRQSSGIAAETMLYAAGTGQLFVRDGAGALYAASIQVDESVLAAAQEGFRGVNCRFAGADYAVYPETLLFEGETLSLPLLAAEPISLFDPQSGAGLENLLDAFGFTAYTNYYSDPSDSVRVFVDDVSTLRVGATGLLQYAAGEDGTVRAYDDGEASGRAALDAQIDCARLILDVAVRAGETDTHASLYAVEQDDSRTTLVFMQMFGGVPVLGDSDFAVFTFERGSLTSATVHLTRFAAQETRALVLPAMQAAAGASGEQARGLMTAYRLTDGVYVPGRFYL